MGKILLIGYDLAMCLVGAGLTSLILVSEGPAPVLLHVAAVIRSFAAFEYCFAAAYCTVIVLLIPLLFPLRKLMQAHIREFCVTGLNLALPVFCEEACARLGIWMQRLRMEPLIALADAFRFLDG